MSQFCKYLILNVVLCLAIFLLTPDLLAFIKSKLIHLK